MNLDDGIMERRLARPGLIMQLHRPRFTLRRMMIAVAVIAINLAALRILIASRRPDLSIGVLASLGVLQVGVSQTLRDRGRRRTFWLGFIVGAMLAIIPMLATIYIPRSSLAAAWLVEDRLVHVPLEDVRNALFQRRSLETHRTTGTALLWAEYPMIVVMTAWAAGLMAGTIRGRFIPFDK